MTKTIHYQSIFDEKNSEEIFLYLKNNISWEDGIYSKKAKQISRKAYSLDMSNEHFDYILNLISITLSKTEKIKGEYLIFGIYLNYYRDGSDFCPAHSHPGFTQLILSFGTTRNLFVGKKEYPLKSGDAIIFGGSSHKIEKNLNINTGRISIAVFLQN